MQVFRFAFLSLNSQPAVGHVAVRGLLSASRARPPTDATSARGLQRAPGVSASGRLEIENTEAIVWEMLRGPGLETADITSSYISLERTLANKRS